MPDDHGPARTPDAAEAFDIETEEGLDAYMLDLERRRGTPERLRYPETDEAYAAAVAEAEASGYVPAAEVFAWLESLGTDRPLPRPVPRAK